MKASVVGAFGATVVLLLVGWFRPRRTTEESRGIALDLSGSGLE